jgi:hypothetical protein
MPTSPLFMPAPRSPSNPYTTLQLQLQRKRLISQLSQQTDTSTVSARDYTSYASAAVDGIRKLRLREQGSSDYLRSLNLLNRSIIILGPVISMVKLVVQFSRRLKTLYNS